MNTIPQAFIESATKHADSPCLLYKEDHTFGFVSYRRLLNLVENFTLSLEKLGVKKGDRIAILSENRPEWVVSDLSVTSLGAIFAPIHTVLTSEQVKEVILELEPKIIIVSDKRLLMKLIKLKKEIERKVIILYYNIDLKEDLSEFKNDKCHFIEALKLLPHENYGEHYRGLVNDVAPNDTASIIYTIGPNGKYRGVELSHLNLISNAKGTLENVYIKPDDKFLSVLPLTHAFEKMAGYYIPLIQGSCISYLSDITKFSQSVREQKPTIIIGVPRLYEKSYRKIHRSIEQNKIAKYLLNKAVANGKKVKSRNIINNKFYEHMVYRKVRDQFGGKVRFMISGGAALNPEVGTFFNTCGMPILEGYGLTEFAPIVSVNKPEHNKVGTVGFPLPNAQIKVSDDGEILLKGPSVMKGYYNNGSGPKLYLEKGWFKTGDLGEFDGEGYLKIIGRKKEVLVLSTGKNISPRSIESQLTLSPYIKQAVVVGDDEKHIAALIVPNFIKIEKIFCLVKRSSIVNNPDIRKYIQNEIDKQLQGFAKHEQVKKFALILNTFTKENRFLNDDSSLNRDRINNLYKREINSLFS